MPQGGPGAASHRLARDCEGDAEAFCRLYNSLYARRVDAAYYRWQFFATPFASRLAFACEGDEVVGCFGMQERPGPDGLLAAWVIDMMVGRGRQGRGIFRAMAAYAASQLDPETAGRQAVLANAAGAAALSGTSGWRRVSDLVDHVCPVTSHGFSRRASGLAFDPVGDPGADAFEILADAASGCHGGCRRTPAFVRWRFGQHPHYRYDLFLASRGGAPCGFLALKQFCPPGGGEACGDIVDWLALDADPALHESLLWFALERFRSSGVRLATCWLQSHTAFDHVAAAGGFRSTDRRRAFCVPGAAGQAPGWLDPLRWRLTMADAEIY